MLSVLIGFCRFVFALSLGAVECDSHESDPQQQIEHLQSGKQFDHVNPINLKSIILLSTYIYTCIATLC